MGFRGLALLVWLKPLVICIVSFRLLIMLSCVLIFVKYLLWARYPILITTIILLNFYLLGFWLIVICFVLVFFLVGLLLGRGGGLSG